MQRLHLPAQALTHMKVNRNSAVWCHYLHDIIPEIMRPTDQKPWIIRSVHKERLTLRLANILLIFPKFSSRDQNPARLHRLDKLLYDSHLFLGVWTLWAEAWNPNMTIQFPLRWLPPPSSQTKGRPQGLQLVDDPHRQTGHSLDWLVFRDLLEVPAKGAWLKRMHVCICISLFSTRRLSTWRCGEEHWNSRSLLGSSKLLCQLRLLKIAERQS